MMTVRVRYAPSPTGHLHIGSVRTALFNYLFARHHGGAFILRIEDTDLERNVPGAEAEFLDGFRWLGLDWDEGPDIGGPHAPYRCTERLQLYMRQLQTLKERDWVYPCFCTADELAAEREQALAEGRTPRYSGRCRHLTENERAARAAAGLLPNWRFAVPAGETIQFDDLVRGTVTFATDDLGDFVVMKSNGFPTYNFQVTVDDALMGITHIIRGEEHLSNTPRQILIYRALGWDAPTFAHLPQVLNQDRKKLSKRDPNVKPVHAYRELGYLPQALVNFIALLGWSPGTEEEIFTLDELVQRFDISRVNKSGAVFDADKLQWMANQYLRKVPADRLAEMVADQLKRADIQLPAHADAGWLGRVATLYQEQMSCAADFVALARGFLGPEIDWSDAALQVLREPGALSVVERYRELCAGAEEWTADGSRQRFRLIQQELGVKGRALFMPVRAAVTGEIHGPDLQESIACLPREWVLRRLAEAVRVAQNI